MQVKEKTNYTRETIKKGDLSKWINEKWLRKTNEDNDMRITRDELESRMGIGRQTLKKVINGTRPTSSRDYIIAICSQLGMNSEETNKALYLYNMPPLCINSQNNPDKKYFFRDSLIINLLDQSDKDWKNRKIIVKSIDTINSELRSRKLAELDIPDRKIKSKVLLDYEVLDEKTRLNIEDSFFDRYESLGTQYNIDMYSCNTMMLIEIKKTKELLVLNYSNSGRCSIYKYEEGIDYLSCNKYSTSENFKKYEECFAQLKIKNKTELMNINYQLDDTKNYRERISAKYDDGKIIIFMESFNYYIPELNEYYFIDYTNGEMHYSISNKSQFMYNKMKKNEYLNVFDKYDSKEIASGNSIDALIESYNNDLSGRFINDYIEKRVRKEILGMEKNIISFKDDLKNKKIFIRNPKIVKDNINPDYMLCRYYKVEDKFKFKKEKDDYEEYYILVKSEIIYKDAIISISDLYSAFELGLDSIDDIYNVKNIYGNIEVLRENL